MKIFVTATSLSLLLLFPIQSIAQRAARPEKIKLSKEEKTLLVQFKEAVGACAQKKLTKAEKICRKQFPFPKSAPKPPKPYAECVEAAHENLSAECNRSMSKMLQPKLFAYWNSYYAPDGRKKRKLGQTPGRKPGTKRTGSQSQSSDQPGTASGSDDWLTEFE